MKRALVYGLGISGKAAADLLMQQGFEVLGYDDRLSSIAYKEVKRFDPLDEACWRGIEFVVLSPGISSEMLFYQQLRQRKLPLIGEAEFSLRLCQQPAIGITGTNGKTTVTLLCEHLLKCSGKKARALGNVGTPLSAYFLSPDPAEILVVEMSSYQLETLQCKIFQTAAILNITPDHLDRYFGMEAYAKAKWRIEKNLTRDGTLFVHHKTAEEFGYLSEEKRFSLFGVDSEKIASLFPVSYRNCGRHDWENGIAAWLLCQPWGVTAAQFSTALESFVKPRHRIEFVASIDGVAYYDDSKGTNVDAVVKAVHCMKGPVVLIAGGVDKGGSYALWSQELQGKIKSIIAIGEAAEKIAGELKGYFPVEIVASLEAAVVKAGQQAEKNDSVLLSPGCASFDMFRDYKQRGEEFKRIVLEERRKTT